MKNLDNLSIKQQTALMERIAHKALMNYDIGNNPVVQLLNHRENAVFSVETSNNKYALRIHRQGYHSDAALRSELQWMEALTNFGLHTPSVIKGKTGDTIYLVSVDDYLPHQVDLLAWVDGVVPNPKNIVASYHSLGALNAKLHQHSLSWDIPKDFTRHAWDEEGMLGERPIWGSYKDLELLSTKQLELLNKAKEIALEKLLKYGKDKDRYGLIHADMMPENILINDNDINLIDFDDGGYGWFMYDFATSLAMHQAESFYPAIKKSWLEGYQSIRPLSSEDLEMVPTFIICRILVALGWFHTRRHTDFAKKHQSNLSNLAMIVIRAYVETEGQEVGKFSIVKFLKEMLSGRIGKMLYG